MENTDRVLFEDDSPHWYIAKGERWIGPLSASDVYKRVTSQEISWAHFVWKQGQAEWKRLCDVPTFKVAVPQAPAKTLQNEVKESSRPNIQTKAPPKEADVRAWFLYFNESQIGPFTQEEVARFLQVGKITSRVHTWKGGMSNWKRLEELEEFKVVTQAHGKTTEGKAQTQAAAKAEKSDQRNTPRRPMVAKIRLHNQKEFYEAMCRDISVGGMQVLTDLIPGEVGEKIKLNVSSGSLEPFVADGEIVRILEDSRGFSFRFNKLTDAAKVAIEKYIQS